MRFRAAAAAANVTDIGDSNLTAAAAPAAGGGVVWRPVGEKTSVLREARYVPLNATRDERLPKKSEKNGRVGSGGVATGGLDDPVRVAKARVALHESKFALGLPKPCDFEQATLMGLHERLQEANACARQLGLGTRYRTVPAGPRSIRIEVYYPEEGGGVREGAAAAAAVDDDDDGRKKKKKKKKRFVSVEAFMNSESRLLLQASYGVGGNVFLAMRNNTTKQRRPLSAAAAGQTTPRLRSGGRRSSRPPPPPPPPPKMIAAAAAAAAGKEDGAASKMPSWR